MQWYRFVVLICISLITLGIFHVLASHLYIFFGEKSFVF